MADAAIHALSFRCDLEPACGPKRILGRTEQQYAAVAQGEVERLDHPRLGIRAQVDQHVAAGHHVEAGKRRIGQHVLHREHDRGTQVRRRPPIAILANEKPRQPLRRDSIESRRSVSAVPRRGDRLGFHVGGEHLQLDRPPCPLDFLQEQDGERVALLPRAAAGHPDAQWFTRAVALHQVWDGGARQCFEHRRVAEEAGDVDQQVSRQCIQLGAVGLQHGMVAGHVVGPDARKRHAPADAAAQGAGLVEREGVPGLGLQEVEDVRHAAGILGGRPRFVRLARCGDAVADQGARDPGKRQHEIREVSGDRVAGHAVIGRLRRVLHSHDAAMRLDGAQALGAIGPGSGQHDTGSALAILAGK